MTPRDNAFGVLERIGSTKAIVLLRELEEAGLRIVGQCKDCKRWGPEEGDCQLFLLADVDADDGCTRWESKEAKDG